MKKPIISIISTKDCPAYTKFFLSYILNTSPSDEYIYKLYHDGEGSIKPDGSIIPKYDHGGLDLSKEKVCLLYTSPSPRD